MKGPNARGERTHVSRLIKASPHKVYRAFLDPDVIATWLAPDNMQMNVLAFDPWEGGCFRISLTYQNPEDAHRGKTAGSMDTYHGRFIKLIPDTVIVEVIEFETDDPEFAGEMSMTVRLIAVDGGTEVSLNYENVPAGIRPEDNEEGSRQSLRKLADVVEE